MKKRWIGLENPDPQNKGEDAGHDVVIGGRSVGTVKHGEILTIPDEVWAQIEADCKEHDVPLPVWPESLWEDVRESKPALKKGDG